MLCTDKKQQCTLGRFEPNAQALPDCWYIDRSSSNSALHVATKLARWAHTHDELCSFVNLGNCCCRHNRMPAAYFIRSMRVFPELRSLLDDFVDVLTRANNPHFISAVYLQQLDIKAQRFINLCPFWRSHLTVLVLVSILWLDD